MYTLTSHTEVETVFMPYLMEETEKALNKRLVARTLLDGTIIATYIVHHFTFTLFGIYSYHPKHGGK